MYQTHLIIVKLRAGKVFTECLSHRCEDPRLITRTRIKKSQECWPAWSPSEEMGTRGSLGLTSQLLSGIGIGELQEQ